MIQKLVAVTSSTNTITDNTPSASPTSENQARSEIDYSRPAIELISDAIRCWSLQMQEKYNPTGDITTNKDLMPVDDIPSNVYCYVGAESYRWMPTRYQRWILYCSRTSDTNDYTTFAINGTAVQRLTGGIFYDTINPTLVYGMGDWPSSCYVPTKTSSGTSEIENSNESSKTPVPQEFMQP